MSFVILVNGGAKCWTKASKALRHGVPFSPFLCTIAMDVLSRMVVNAKDREILEGFLAGKDKTRFGERKGDRDKELTRDKEID